MKKIFGKLKNNCLFTFILGILLCSGVVYGASIYESNNIKYNPTDTSWEVSNVSEAINSLYEKLTNNTFSKEAYEVTSGQGNKIISLVSLELTDTNVDNYILQVTSIPDAGGIYVGWVDQDNQFPHLIGSTPTLEIVDGNIVISGMECKGGHMAANVYATTEIKWKLYHF